MSSATTFSMKRWLAGSSNTSSLDGSTYRRGMLAESTSQQCTNTLVSGKQIPEYPPPDTPSYCLHIGESASMQVSDNSKIAGIHLIKESGADSHVELKTPLCESKHMLFLSLLYTLRHMLLLLSPKLLCVLHSHACSSPMQVFTVADVGLCLCLS